MNNRYLDGHTRSFQIENELYLNRYSLKNVQFYVKYCKINFYSLANMSSVW